MNRGPGAKAARDEPRALGRYTLLERIASGGMGAVHLGRVEGAGGFARVVAIKRLHPEFAREAESKAMLLDEARLAARVRHPSVAQTHDIFEDDGELFLVMEYVLGDSLSRLLAAATKRSTRVPPAVVSAVVLDLLHGLHAAHEARGDDGEPLLIVHRDVSPHNVLVGIDGVARVVDFGIAKALGRLQHTRDGLVKGKAAYMSPEQGRGAPLDRRSDLFSAGIVLWEALTGRRAFDAENPLAMLTRVVMEPLAAPSSIALGLPPAVDAVVLTATAKDPAERFPTALAFAQALEHVLPPAPKQAVAAWLEDVAGPKLAKRAARFREASRENGAARLPLPSGEELGTSPDAVPFTTITSARRRGTAIGIALGVVGLVAVLLVLASFRGLLPARAAGRERDRIAKPVAPLDIPRRVANVPPPPAPSASGPIDPAPEPSVTSPARAGGRRPGKRPGKEPKPERACDPPFTVGEGGIFVPKPECL